MNEDILRKKLAYEHEKEMQITNSMKKHADSKKVRIDMVNKSSSYLSYARFHLSVLYKTGEVGI